MPHKNYDIAHLQTMLLTEHRIKRAYEQAIDDFIRIYEWMEKPESEDDTLEFDKQPLLKPQVEKIMKRLGQGVNVVVVDGVKASWNLAQEKNNELTRAVFGRAKTKKLTPEQLQAYFTRNEEGLKAFLERKIAGMNLSDRVWKLTASFKEEMEIAIEQGMRDGRSAYQLSRDIRQYLKQPNMLFRRVRDKKTGRLKLSKRAANYHPGQGVYRSSYKNARRLAATEGNIAYRTADHERWQTMSFVVGFEIKLSNNHTCLNDQGKAVRFHCMCDDLQGKYPKDFKFTGWHPHCRCFAIPILKTEEEMAEDNKRILRGEEVTNGGVNQVNDVPKAFKDWVADNEGRLQRAKSLPYFLAENPKYAGVTPRMQGVSGFRGTKLGRQATKDATKIYDDRPAPTLTSEQRTNINDIAKVLNTTPKPMTFLEADEGKGNVGYGRREYGYNTNCAATVLIHEARLRGLNITALPYSPDPNGLSFQLGENTAIGWRTEKGKTPTVTTLKAKSDDELFRKLDGQTKSAGRYHIGINFDQSHGHIITAERFSDGKIVFYDAQSGAFLNIKEYSDLESFEVLKVDKLLFAPDIIKAICRLL